MAAYDGINFAPPAGVRGACARGIALREEGYGGDGLQPETVAWARRLSAGDRVSPEKARKMNAWFARHGASPEENRARREDKTSPAWVAWLLWGGDAGRSWSARLVRQMDARDKAARTSRTMQGVGVKLDAVVSGGGDSPWNVLAYEVALQGRGDVALARADFEQCVANFMRWGKEVPVVLYHADTDAKAHPLAREAHAWITAMRVGSMQRDGKTVATLEARFRWVNAETRASVERGALAYGSVTLVQNGVDEESGAEIGSYLWSFSLTNNPALVDIPRLTAERRVSAGRYYGAVEDRDDVLAMLRAELMLPALASEADVTRELDKLAAMVGSDEDETGVDVDDIIECIREAMRLPALTTADEVIAAVRKALASPMSGTPDSASNALPMQRGHAPASLHQELTMSHTFITLAARLGIACTDEGAAQQQVLARAEESLPIRRQLGLSVDASAKDVAARIDALNTDAARVTALSAEVEALKVIEADRAAREVAAHVDALCADPAMARSRVALEAFARADYAGFSKAYPRPSAGSVSTLSQRVTAPASETPSTLGSEESHTDRADALATELMAKTPGLTYAVALSRASAILVQKAVS
jgi:hypothetical protein